jgi:hypothetical protein
LGYNGQCRPALQTIASEQTNMAKKRATDQNLPTVSKQTAGGVTGAVIGGIVAGPVGAVAGGVAGALVGNSSAKGNEPIKKAVAQIRSVGMRGAKAIEAARARHKTPAAKLSPAKKSAGKSSGLKSTKKPSGQKATKRAAKTKVAAKPKHAKKR